ncbi:unnamed protein product [Ostreobium quekettii]|uniref:Uncharacterized protein n=1 Tax=Ostreobium quekettii TaxID=121088 RepID=A0A8S1IW22_9CHLO|nr:unnamed protein product [Ostreobium quekettii]|eukprot:evm.model.scf_66EXC.4 EVM.evm.TU.scf_66EXC.4   scf_66EXC:57252-59663(-)
MQAERNEINEDRVSLQKEAQALKDEGDRMAEAMAFLERKIEEFRDLSQNLPAMVEGLRSSRQKLDAERAGCLEENARNKSERQALEEQRLTQEAARLKIAQERKLLSEDRNAAHRAAGDAREARRHLSEAIRVASKQGLVATVFWDSSRATIQTAGPHGCETTAQAIDVNADGHENFTNHDAEHSRNPQAIHRQRKNSQTNAEKRGRGTLMKLVRQAGLDFNSLERSASQATAYAASQAAFIQQLRASHKENLSGAAPATQAGSLRDEGGATHAARAPRPQRHPPPAKRHTPVAAGAQWQPRGAPLPHQAEPCATPALSCPATFVFPAFTPLLPISSTSDSKGTPPKGQDSPWLLTPGGLPSSETVTDSTATPPTGRRRPSSTDAEIVSKGSAGEGASCNQGAPGRSGEARAASVACGFESPEEVQSLREREGDECRGARGQSPRLVARNLAAEVFEQEQGGEGGSEEEGLAHE